MIFYFYLINLLLIVVELNKHNFQWWLIRIWHPTSIWTN